MAMLADLTRALGHSLTHCNTQPTFWGGIIKVARIVNGQQALFAKPS